MFFDDFQYLQGKLLLNTRFVLLAHQNMNFPLLNTIRLAYIAKDRINNWDSFRTTPVLNFGVYLHYIYLFNVCEKIGDPWYVN